MKLMIILLILLLPIYICSQDEISDDVFDKYWNSILTIIHDDFDNADIISLRAEPITYKDAQEALVFLNLIDKKGQVLVGAPYIVKIKNKNPKLYFNITYSGNKWIFIEEKESLKFLIADSIHYNFSGTIKRRTGASGFAGGQVTEIASYEFTAEEMKQIFYADNLKIKLIGNDGSFSGIVPELTKRFWRKFYSEFIRK